MSSKTQADVEKTIALTIVSFLLIITVLAFYTSNPEQGTPNQELSSEECKSINFYAPECPLDNNQSSSNQSQTQTNPSNESVNTSG